MVIGVEESNRELFAEFLRSKALDCSREFYVFPLNGQDRDAAGDVIFSDRTRLSLIEFKSYQNDLRDEGRKPKRKKLCEMLLDNDDMQKHHDRCHFACWKDDTSLMLNIYRHEICNKCVFPTADGLPAVKTSNRRFSIDNYAESFITTEKVSLSLDEFEKYLAWVMKETSDSERSTVSVQVRDLYAKRFTIHSFNSLRDAHGWIELKRDEIHTHRPKPF